MSQLTFDATAAKAVEAIYMTPDVVAQRARVIELLAPTPGERILDVGVGPGLLALDVARLGGASGRLVGPRYGRGRRGPAGGAVPGRAPGR